jgi:putative ABC transport system permease protein
MIMKPGLISGALAIVASAVVVCFIQEDSGSGSMNLYQLAIKNISGNSFRSGCSFFVCHAGGCFYVDHHLADAWCRNQSTSGDRSFGCRYVWWCPQGSESKIESALLMGVPAKFWMPEDNVNKIAAVPGVEAVSPQFYLAALTGASCCSVPDMFMIAYDPKTDFTIQPLATTRN